MLGVAAQQSIFQYILSSPRVQTVLVSSRYSTFISISILTYFVKLLFSSFHIIVFFFMGLLLYVTHVTHVVFFKNS
jgi:hypothetical protein